MESVQNVLIGIFWLTQPDPKLLNITKPLNFSGFYYFENFFLEISLFHGGLILKCAIQSFLRSCSLVVRLPACQPPHHSLQKELQGLK